MNSFVRFRSSSHKKQKKINCQKINSKIFDKKKIVQKFDMKNWIETELKFLWICFVSMNEKNEKTKNFEKMKKLNVLNENYFEKFEIIVQYLWNFKKSSEMIISKFRKWKKKIFNFKMQNRKFFRRNIKNVFLLKIVDDQKKRNKIIKHMHNDSEHWKRKKTFCRIVDRYYWKNMYEKIQTYVKICERCQFKNFRREKKILHFIWISYLWQKIIMNVVHMFKNHEKNFFVVTKNDLFE